MVDFATEVEEVYCKCLQHKLQAAQLLQVVAWKGKGLYGGQQRSTNHGPLQQVPISGSMPGALPSYRMHQVCLQAS